MRSQPRPVAGRRTDVTTTRVTSTIDVGCMAMDEPLRPDDARRLIGNILRTGSVFLGRHAKKAMADDNLIQQDCLDVLRGGVVDPGELERGAWRYRVRTKNVTVVVAFNSEAELAVVTVWRNKA